MTRQQAIISIGYEGRTPGELVALLLAHHVQKVVDVRELPLSRRKGFSKTPLSAALRAAGIAYQHVRAAGNPHRHAASCPAECLALYSTHLKNHPEVLDTVDAELDGAPVAFLCFERQHVECHRSRLLESLQSFRPIQIVRVE